LAAGYQPAVVKVVSYARGVARATATGQYVLREDVPLETQDGRVLADRQAVADEIKAWSGAFAQRAESQDVGALRLTLAGVGDTPEGRAIYRQAISAAFEGHRYAYRFEAKADGELEARVVVAMAGAGKERFRVRETAPEEGGYARKQLDRSSQARIMDRIAAATELSPDAVSVTIGATGHGRDGAAYRLNKLIDGGPARDDQGKSIENVADIRSAAREWGPTLRSQSARDTMHLIVSAKAGTDVEALRRAARNFLQDTFADHKFMFGVHVDKATAGHIHAHAVIAVKNEAGQKIHPGRETFGEWRRAYAEHAQAEGLKIVATSERERASSQSYGPRDKAIVETADRPRASREARDRAYAADPVNRGMIDKARQRIAIARTNPIRLAVSAPDRERIDESVSAWRVVASEQPRNEIASAMLERLTMAQTVGGVLGAIEKRVTQLTSGRPDMAVTSEQMAKDLRLMNEAVSRTSDLLEGETKQQFHEASARYLETLANRIDFQRASERGLQQMTRAEVEAIAGPKADRLIERANATRSNESQEAAAAARFADRAIEAERREEAVAGLDATSQKELRTERAVVANATASAAQEASEAKAATEAARSLSRHPGEPLPPPAAQTDALGGLRAEQEKIIRDIEASESAEPQSQKGQHLGSKGTPRV
jgi:type IV secretory pathway VirD2 relaxase